MIRVVVCGAGGRMGKLLVKTLSEQPDMELAAAVDATENPSVGVDAGELAGVGELGARVIGANRLTETLEEAKPDVLVDFTVADAAVQNVRAAARAGIAVVVGTTGFSKEQMADLERAIKEGNIPAIVAPNMSVGVNVFFKLAGEAGRLLKDHNVELVETHHAGKKDAPSGTALKAAKIVSEASGRDFEKVKELGEPEGELGERSGDKFWIKSIREGDVVGDHALKFGDTGERIELIHSARSRKTFALGTMRAIRHVVEKGKPGEIQDMQDVLGLRG